MSTLDLSTITLDGPIPFPPWVEDPRTDVSSIEDIPRPRNSFFIYRNHWNAKLRTLRNEGDTPTPKTSQESLSKMIGRKWGELDDEARRPYAEAAEREKAAHKVVWPDWRYDPVLKAEKAAVKAAVKAAKVAERAAAKSRRGAEKAREEEERRARRGRAPRPAPYSVPQRGRHEAAAVPATDARAAPGAPIIADAGLPQWQPHINAEAGPSQWQPIAQHPPALVVGLCAPPAAMMPALPPVPPHTLHPLDVPLPLPPAPESVEEDADEFGFTPCPHPYDEELQWGEDLSYGDY